MYLEEKIMTNVDSIPSGLAPASQLSGAPTDDYVEEG